MPAKIIEIADAVAADLNAAPKTGAPGFSQAFTAERTYRPTFDLADLKTLKVTVVPKAVTATAVTRTKSQYDCQIDVAVQKKFSEMPADGDALMALVQEIADYLRGRPLAGCSDAAWLGCQNVPVFVPEHVEEFRQITSILTLTYRATR